MVFEPSPLQLDGNSYFLWLLILGSVPAALSLSFALLRHNQVARVLWAEHERRPAGNFNDHRVLAGDRRQPQFFTDAPLRTDDNRVFDLSFSQAGRKGLSSNVRCGTPGSGTTRLPRYDKPDGTSGWLWNGVTLCQTNSDLDSATTVYCGAFLPCLHQHVS